MFVLSNLTGNIDGLSIITLVPFALVALISETGAATQYSLNSALGVNKNSSPRFTLCVISTLTGHFNGDKLARLSLSTHAKLLLYADDLVLVKPLKSTQSELELQTDINAINDCHLANVVQLGLIFC